MPTVPGVDTLAHDFSVTPTDASVARLVAACAERDVGVLVNNVGASYPSALYFHEVEGVEPGLTRSMVATNVNVRVHARVAPCIASSVTRRHRLELLSHSISYSRTLAQSVIEMTKAVLPGMLARKRGAIVNISSANGRVPTGSPLYALYAGTKAFVEAFSRSLAGEYARRGLTVTCQSPYFVVSKLSKIRAASLGVPTPAAYAAAAVAAIGDGPSTVPYLAHAAQDAVVQGAPHFLLSRLTLSMHESIRARFMAKRARESKTA